MADGKQELFWSHTSALLSELMNGPSKRKDKQRWSARMLNPFAKKTESPEIIKVSPKDFVKSLLKSMW